MTETATPHPQGEVEKVIEEILADNIHGGKDYGEIAKEIAQAFSTYAEDNERLRAANILLEKLRGEIAYLRPQRDAYAKGVTAALSQAEEMRKALEEAKRDLLNIAYNYRAVDVSTQVNRIDTALSLMKGGE